MFSFLSCFEKIYIIDYDLCVLLALFRRIQTILFLTITSALIVGVFFTILIIEKNLDLSLPNPSSPPPTSDPDTLQNSNIIEPEYKNEDKSSISSSEKKSIHSEHNGVISQIKRLISSPHLGSNRSSQRTQQEQEQEKEQGNDDFIESGKQQLPVSDHVSSSHPAPLSSSPVPNNPHSLYSLSSSPTRRAHSPDSVNSRQHSPTRHASPSPPLLHSRSASPQMMSSESSPIHHHAHQQKQHQQSSSNTPNRKRMSRQPSSPVSSFNPPYIKTHSNQLSSSPEISPILNVYPISSEIDGDTSSQSGLRLRGLSLDKVLDEDERVMVLSTRDSTTVAIVPVVDGIELNEASFVLKAPPKETPTKSRGIKLWLYANVKPIRVLVDWWNRVDILPKFKKKIPLDSRAVRIVLPFS